MRSTESVNDSGAAAGPGSETTVATRFRCLFHHRLMYLKWVVALGLRTNF